MFDQSEHLILERLRPKLFLVAERAQKFWDLELEFLRESVEELGKSSILILATVLLCVVLGVAAILAIAIGAALWLVEAQDLALYMGFFILAGFLILVGAGVYAVAHKSVKRTSSILKTVVHHWENSRVGNYDQ